MISINLLRHTLENEHNQRRRCLVEGMVLLLMVIGTVGVCGLVWVNLERSFAQLQSEKEFKVVQLGQWERTHSQFEGAKRQIVDLRNRSEEITNLVVQQRRSIQILDTVSRSLDPLKLWLTGLEMEKEQVTLLGFAESKTQIVELAQFLKQAGLFEEVTVLEAGRTSEEPLVYHFTMNLLLISGIHDVTSS